MLPIAGDGKPPHQNSVARPKRRTSESIQCSNVHHCRLPLLPNTVAHVRLHGRAQPSGGTDGQRTTRVPPRRIGHILAHRELARLRGAIQFPFIGILPLHGAREIVIQGSSPIAVLASRKEKNLHFFVAHNLHQWGNAPAYGLAMTRHRNSSYVRWQRVPAH